MERFIWVILLGCGVLKHTPYIHTNRAALFRCGAGTVLCGPVLCGKVLYCCGATRCDSVLHGAAPFDTVRHCAAQCGTVLLRVALCVLDLTGGPNVHKLLELH